MMSEKVMKWRSSPFHRKCIFCEYLKLIVVKCDPARCYYKCSAKDKYICDVLPDMTRIPRPFCSLFTLKQEEE